MTGQDHQPDAEFVEIVKEPHTASPSGETTSQKTAKTTGPGWLSLICATVIAGTSGLGGAYWLDHRAENAADITPVIDTDARQSAADAEAQILRLTSALETLSSEQAKLERDLYASIDALRTELLESVPTGSDTPPDFDEIIARLDAIDALLDSAGSGVATFDLTEITNRLDALETNPQPQPASAASLPTGPSLEQMQGLIDENVAVTTRLAEQATDISDLTTRLAEMESGLLEAQESLDAVIQNEDMVSQALISGRQMADRAVSFSVVEASASVGEPFPNAWQRLSANMPESAGVKILSGVSDTGAPSNEQLERDFVAVRQRIADLISTGQNNSDDGLGWVRQTLGEGASIRVKSSEPLPVEQDLALAGERLAHRDLAGAVTALNRLPDALRAPADDWISLANRRISLDLGVAVLRRQLILGGEE